MLLAVEHLLEAGFVVAYVALCYAAGSRLLARFASPSRRSLEFVCFSVAIGAGLIAMSVLAGGILFGLRSAVLAFLLVAWVLFARRQLVQLPQATRRCVRELATDCRPWALAIFVIAAAFMFAQGLAPPTDWDSLVYHLELPSRFLAEGRLYAPDGDFHLPFVGLVHMLYVPLLAFAGPAAPALLNVCFALLLGLAVLAFGSRYLGGLTASLSLALLWGTTTVVLVAVTPRIDVTLAFYLFLGHYALITALTDSEERWSFYLSAALLGLAFAVKYLALLYMAALIPLVILAASWRSARPWATARSLALFGTIALVCALPWLGKNLLLLDSPFYPYIGGWKFPAWVAELAGVQLAPSTIDLELLQLSGQARQAFSLTDLFLRPGRLTVEGEGSYYFTNPIFLLLPLWLLFFRERVPAWLCVPALTYLVLLIAPFPTTNLRYLVPAIPALTLVAANVAARITRRFRSRIGRAAVLGALCLVALLPTTWMAIVWLTSLRTGEYVLGKASREEYLHDYPVANFPAYLEVAEYVNENLPADARVLMFLEARGYYFERATIQDNLLINWPMLASVLPEGACPDAGVASHVALNTVALAYFTRRGMDLEVLRWREFPSFAERCLEQIYQTFGFVLFRIRVRGPRGRDDARASLVSPDSHVAVHAIPEIGR